MRRILFLCLDASIAALVLVPMFLYLNKQFLHDNKKLFGYTLFSVYLCAMFSVVGLPDIRYIRFDLHCNFIPFAYMFSDYTNSILNVLLFMPLGFFLPVFWKRFASLRRSILFGLNVSMLVEALQIFTLRATDVNDLITNTFGTLLGWIIGRLAVRCIPWITPQEKNGGLRIIFGSTLLIMVFVHPFLEAVVWQMISLIP